MGSKRVYDAGDENDVRLSLGEVLGTIIFGVKTVD